jgi:PKD repeat protein
MNGYGVVFDTWQNPGEPSHNWVGFIDTARQGSGAFSAVNVPEEFTGNGVFHVRVTGKNGTFTVAMRNDGIGMALRELFTYTAPAFAGGDAYFGFTAGTGSAFSRHVVDNFVLQVRGSAPPVVAAFHADVTTGDAPITVSFVNDSTGANGYSWSFGDGSTSLQVSPQHTYENPGSYAVSLSASGPGGSAVLVKQDYITARAVLEADFKADKTIGAKGMSVRFTDLTQSNVGSLTYAWDFGDGGTSTFRITSHVYRTAGQFTVSLKVTGPGGLSSTMTKPNYIQVDDVLAADFTAQPVTGPAPLLVKFNDGSTGLTIQSWSWTFGDGSTATVQNPSHTYSSPGTYTVKLMISGYQSVQSMEKPGYVVVQAPNRTFLRGDGNTDGTVDISDAISVLMFLYTGGIAPPCHDAMDANDDGSVDISDPISIMVFLFNGGARPNSPFPDAGLDPTPDGLPGC